MGVYKYFVANFSFIEHKFVTPLTNIKSWNLRFTKPSGLGGHSYTPHNVTQLELEKPKTFVVLNLKMLKKRLMRHVFLLVNLSLWGQFSRRVMVNSYTDYNILQKATNKFHQNNILGVGGFGCVYKVQFNNGFLRCCKEIGLCKPWC